MIDRAATSLLTAMLLVAFAAPPVDAQDDLPTIAVLDLADGGSMGPDAQDLSQLGKGIAAMLTTEMMDNPRVRMIERDQIRQLTQEQALSLGGAVDQATAVEAGRLLGARYMVFGSYTDVYGTLRIDLRVVDVESGAVQRARELTDARENLFRNVATLAGRLFDDLDLAPAARPAPPAPIPARATLLLSRGLGYEDRGELDEARRMYREALEIAPDLGAARDALDRIGGEG